MKRLSILTFTLLLVGCSGEQVSHNITKTQIAMGGNKPPAFFRVANIETMRDYVFDTKDFSFKFPTAKQSDFTKMDGWRGGSSRNGKTITVYLDLVYHIDIGVTENMEYTARERAIEYKDVQNIKNRMRLDRGDILYIQNNGKESYPCTVVHTYNKVSKKKKSIYDCYKFNPARTKAKSVTVSLTYNKSTVKGYTYKDLKTRAKRTLDSLYIKDGW